MLQEVNLKYLAVTFQSEMSFDSILIVLIDIFSTGKSAFKKT